MDAATLSQQNTWFPDKSSFNQDNSVDVQTDHEISDVTNKLKRKTWTFQIELDTSRDLPKWSWSMSNWKEKTAEDTAENEATEDSQEANKSESELTLPRVSVYRRDLMIQSPVCSADLVEELWQEKSGLDQWFDADEGLLYRKARRKVHPEERLDRSLFLNRQGMKLKEVTESLNILGRLFTRKRALVLDILGSTHVWTEFIFGMMRHLQSRGQTIPMNKIRVCSVQKEAQTLADQNVLRNYRAPPNRPQLTPGDHTIIPNLVLDDDMIKQACMEDIVAYLKEQNIPVYLVVADGTIKVGRHPETKEHLENYHELFNARCVISEVVLALKVLAEGGDFIIKVFDTFTSLSVSLLHILRHLFEIVHVIKPWRSRTVNSERYIACVTYRADRSHLVKLLEDIYETWSSGPYLTEYCPDTLVPVSIFKEDTMFMDSITVMATTLCKRQSEALREVQKECLRLSKLSPDAASDTDETRKPKLREGSDDFFTKPHDKAITNRSRELKKWPMPSHGYPGTLTTRGYNPRYQGEYRETLKGIGCEQDGYPIPYHMNHRNNKVSRPGYSQNQEVTKQNLTTMLSAIGVSDVTFADSAFKNTSRNFQRPIHGQNLYPNRPMQHHYHNKSEQHHYHNKSEQHHYHNKSEQHHHNKLEQYHHNKSELYHHDNSEQHYHNKSEQHHNKSEQHHNKSEQHHNKSEQHHNKSEQHHNKSEHYYDKSAQHNMHQRYHHQHGWESERPFAMSHEMRHNRNYHHQAYQQHQPVLDKRIPNERVFPGHSANNPRHKRQNHYLGRSAAVQNQATVPYESGVSKETANPDEASAPNEASLRDKTSLMVMNQQNKKSQTTKGRPKQNDQKKTDSNATRKDTVHREAQIESSVKNFDTYPLEMTFNDPSNLLKLIADEETFDSIDKEIAGIDIRKTSLTPDNEKFMKEYLSFR